MRRLLEKKPEDTHEMLAEEILERTRETRTYHPPPRHVAQAARLRGERVIDTVCAWTRRWGFVSDRTLATLYPVQRRLGAAMTKKGYLEPLTVPAGEHCDDGRTIYRLTEAGHVRVESILPPEVLDIEHSERVSWRLLQHLLDLQRIAVRGCNMLPADPRFRTEPELRALSGDGSTLVPDLLMTVEDAGDPLPGEWWIEYERTAKGDVPLDYWTQALARRVRRAEDERNPQSPHYQPDIAVRQPLIYKITIVVQSERKANRYLRFLERDYAEPRFRDPVTRKTPVYPEKPRQPIASILKPILEITWPAVIDMLYERDPEEQRQAVLDSRYEPIL